MGIRPVDNSSGVYYATVRKSAKLPQVVMRDKGERGSQSSQNRQSLQLSPSTTPVRPPRRKRPESASYESASNSNLYSSSNNINSKTSNLYSSNNNINKSSNLYSSSNNIHNKSFESYSSNSRRETGSLQRGEQRQQDGAKEKYFFGLPVTVQKTPSVRVLFREAQLNPNVQMPDVAVK